MLLKKSIIAAAISVAALSVSATAFAAYDDYSSNPTFISTTSGAGFILGLQGGYGNTHWQNANVSDLGSVSVKDTGFAARLFTGYDFSNCFGLELGYTYLPTAKFTFSGDSFSATENIKEYGLDLLGKIALPVTPVFKIYAKAGLGYLHASGSNDSGDGSNSDGNSHHFGPAYGVGASYEIIPNLAIDATWLRYSGQNDQNSSSYVPDADVALIGLSYKFPTRA